MSDVKSLANSYLNAWNERNPERRRALVESLWTDKGAYVDPLMRGTGYDQIDALIAAVQDRFPDFRFVQDGRVDSHGEYMRFSWSLGPNEADGVIKGTDVALVEDGRFQMVVGFLDKVPAAA